MTSSSFNPDWLSAPGGTILDVMEERDLTSKELASLLKFSIERTERLIAGKEAIIVFDELQIVRTRQIPERLSKAAEDSTLCFRST